LAAPSAHRGELERQLGDPALAAALRERAQDAHRTHGQSVRLAGTEFVAWRGYVWARCRLRKSATCVVTGALMPPGSAAYRQLSEMRDRYLRVSAEAWSGL